MWCCQAGLWFPFMEATEAEAVRVSTFVSLSSWAGLPDATSRARRLPPARISASRAICTSTSSPAFRRTTSRTCCTNGASTAARPPPRSESKGGQVGLACRVICGAQERAADEHKLAAEEEKKRVSTAAPDGATSSVSGPKKIKLSTVTDQPNDLDVPELAPQRVLEAYQRSTHWSR